MARRNNETPLTSYYRANNNNNEFLTVVFVFHQLYLSHFYTDTCQLLALHWNRTNPTRYTWACFPLHYQSITARFDNPDAKSLYWGGKFIHSYCVRMLFLHSLSRVSFHPYRLQRSHFWPTLCDGCYRIYSSTKATRKLISFPSRFSANARLRTCLTTKSAAVSPCLPRSLT